MKLVLFGAGKIGRSFIGQLFSRSGYEVVFIDKDERLIHALNRQRSYKVFICDDHPITITVTNVRGVHADDAASVRHEIASADILAVSIGKNGLPYIVPALADGLLQRSGKPLDMILAENMRHADIFMHDMLQKALPDDFPLDERVGLVETSIGKMVPLVPEQPDGDILSVSAEAYNTLIVNKEAFKNPIPDINGLDAKENMKAWVDRKLFIHNFGHAAVAYYGYALHPSDIYTWQVLEDRILKQMVTGAMRQSADVLQRMYPEVFTKKQLEAHIDDLLQRFANRSLGDTVFRVGCDLYRKLSPDDRVVTPLRCAQSERMPYDKILQVLKAALQFKACDPNGNMLPADVKFHQKIQEEGTETIFREISALDDLLINQICKS